MAENEDRLMLTKEQIMLAIDESQKVKEQYPAFWALYEMVIEMNTGISALQSSMEEDENDNNKKK